MTISSVNALPDIVSVQKKVFPLIFSNIVATQPTKQPIATTYGLKRTQLASDGSGWTPMEFRLDRWFSEVDAIKLKTEISTEAITDMRALGVSENMIMDHMADQIADDINEDIIDKLDKISTVGADIDLAGQGKTYEIGRELYARAHIEMGKLETKTGAQGTYIVAGGDAYGLLLASGWVSKMEGMNYAVAKSGMIVVNDKYSTTPYIIVGVKKVLGETELASVVFSPYDVEGAQGGLAYQLVTNDYQSLNPVFGIMARYALTAAPLKSNTDNTGVHEIDWDNLTDNERSELSTKFTILPWE